MAPLAAVVITHTTRHLRRTLLGVASASRKPELVVVSCDGDTPELESCVNAAAVEFGMDVTLVLRAHTGQSRSGQVRNNGVRAVIDAAVGDETRLVFLDGDCCPAFDCFARHEELAASRDAKGGLVVGFRIDLSPEQTEAFDESEVRAGRAPTTIAREQIEGLEQRDARYRRSALLRRFGLTKSHKPKLLSANFSVRLGDYRAVNGFDTEYVGWGAEDDDLGRRLYAAGVRPVVGVKDAIVYHQWHATRAPSAWHENAGAARFGLRLPVRCLRGLENPLEQPTPRVLRVHGALATSGAGVLDGAIRGASARQ